MKLNDFRRILRENVRLPEPGDAGFVERAKELVPAPGPVFRRRRRVPTRFAAMAGSFALVLAAFVFLVLGATPSTVVTLDINPSVRMELNRFGYVIQVEGTNPEGLLVVDDLDRNWGSLPRILSGILDSASGRGYLADDSADILFGISGASYESEQSLQTEILSLLPAETTETLFLNLHTDADSDLRDGLLVVTEANLWSVFGISVQEATSVTTTSTVYAPSDFYFDQMPEWSAEIDGKYYVLIPDNEAAADYTVGGVVPNGKTVYADLTEAEFSALADSLGVSETKLNLAILVFQGYPSYILPSDLAYLCTLSVGDLLNLYDALP